MIRFLEIHGPNCREILRRPLPKATDVCWKKKTPEGEGVEMSKTHNRSFTFPLQK